MAANETQPNSPRRRRAVTIDLPATAVDAVVGADAPAAEGVPVSVVGEDLAGKETLRPPPSGAPAAPRGAEDIGRAPPRGANGFALVAFAAIGALVVLIGGYLLMFTDILPAPGRADAEAALADVERLEAEIAGLRQPIAAPPPQDLAPLEARLAALEAAIAGIAEIGGRLDALAADAAADRAARTDIAADLAELTREFVAAGAAAGDPQAAAQLGAELDALTLRLAALEAAGPPPEVVALQEEIGRLQEQVAELGAAAEALAVDAVERTRAAEAARVLAFNNLRAAAERGDPFMAELAVLTELGVDPAAVAAIEPAAAAGVLSRPALVGAFPGVAEAILTAGAAPDPEAGFFDRLLENAQNIVTVRPNVPIEGDTPAAIVSRMEAAVSTGDLATALAERAALPADALAASAEWAAAVEARLALDVALTDLAAALQRNDG